MMESDLKKHLPTVLSAMLEKGMKLDEDTLEQVAGAADNIVAQRNEIQEQIDKNSNTITSILGGLKTPATLANLLTH